MTNAEEVTESANALLAFQNSGERELAIPDRSFGALASDGSELALVRRKRAAIFLSNILRLLIYNILTGESTYPS